MHRAILNKPKRLHVNEWIRIVAEEPRRASRVLALKDSIVSDSERAIRNDVWHPHKCVNAGEQLNRTTHPVASRPSVASFYRQALGMHPPPLPHDELIAKAEALLGITESADVALVVNMRQLPQLHARFPWLRVRHWHDTDDMFSYTAFSNAFRLLFRDSMQEAALFSKRYRDTEDELSFAHTRYRRIVNATDDDELWSTTGAEPIPPQLNAGAMPSVDVLLHATGSTPTAQVLRRLSKNTWVRPDQQRDWEVAGRRDLQCEAHSSPLEVVLAQFGRSDRLDTMFIPISHDAWDRAMRPSSAAEELTPAEEAAIAEVRDTLRTLAACGVAKDWPSVTQDAIVSKMVFGVQNAALKDVSDADAELYDLPGLSPDFAARVVTPISAQCVARALDAGHIASGRMALVDARYNDVAKLKDELWQKLYCTSNSDKSFATLAAATRGARDIVFFCNHASTNSPERAMGFHNWLCRDEARVYGDAQPRVRLLADGMNALVRHICAKHGKAGWDARFRYVDSTYRC